MAVLILSYILCAVALVKIIGILLYCKWVLATGRPYRKEVFDSFVTDKGSPQISIALLTSINKKYKIPLSSFWNYSQDKLNGIIKFYRVWIYRQPILVLILSSLIFLTKNSNTILLTVEMYLISFLILSELLNLIFSRIILGCIDNFRTDFLLEPGNPEFLVWNKTHFVEKFTFGAASFMVSSIIGFAALYYGLYCMEQTTYFKGISTHGYHQLEFLYFSIITAATIGYGDISPCYGLPQLIAAFESVFSMGIIVVLIFALSNTFTFEK